MSARRELVSRLVRDYVLHVHAKRTFHATKAEARRSGLLSEVGVRDIALDGDEQIGAVRVQPGQWEARVTDRAAFEAWVEDQHPEWFTAPLTLLRQVEQILHQVREAGLWLDEATEILWEPIPGVERVRSGQPWLDIQASPDALATITRNLPDAVRACLAHLDAALRDHDTAPESQRGACLDDIAAAARNLRDELTAAALTGVPSPAVPTQRAGA